MKLEEIQKEWDKDSKIDGSELGQESLRTPELHNKYFKMLLQVGQDLRGLEAKYKLLFRLKWEYYLGILDKATLTQRKWEQFSLKVLRSDVGTYLDSDLELQETKEKVDFAKTKFEYLESILKTVHNRGFSIKNAIEWERFKTGQ